MATIGIDCELVLDNTGYFLKPASYIMHCPRIRKAEVRADGGESYVDMGRGRKEWHLTILCVNELYAYNGTQISSDGQTMRDALFASYNNSVGTTINFTDPQNGSAIPVHFDSYLERILDLHTQVTALATGGSTPHLSYEVSIVLIEA